MENWGAIAGDDSYFAFGETASPSGVRMAVETIAHEVAHQWFGDLVTLYDWNDLWLNESFATLVVPKITERAHLREDPWGEFMIRIAGAGSPTLCAPPIPWRPTRSTRGRSWPGPTKSPTSREGSSFG